MLIKNYIIFCTLMLFFSHCKIPTAQVEATTSTERIQLADTLEQLLKSNLVDTWYPAAIDTQYGGYLSTFNATFKPVGNQDKMIVSQARHLWNNAKASQHWPAEKKYRDFARHGFAFLQDKMWDKDHGGFFWQVDRSGKPRGDSSKTAYGNAFGLYAVSAYYAASKDPAALAMAQKSFRWLEQYSHDPIHGGYYQHLSKTGAIQKRLSTTPSTSDLGYKDQNSSIHLLEAFTELYQIWPDPMVKTRLEEMIYLIRDKIVNEKGNLVLFFQPDWTPVSFRDSSRTSILRHHALDHVSWGHDIETAYLLMEASHVAGWHNDTITWRIAKKMTDQCLNLGWDDALGGFYDEGYFFKPNGITVTQDTKNWWTQAEALNTLLIMADLYPRDPLDYYSKFKKQWAYIKQYLIDHQNGEWYDSGLDKDPRSAQRNKGHIWKAGYHQYRTLENCILRLREKHK
ncbi:MAG: AGE family epimerase/isomerase [Haliscomenobacter sp.]|nr:AGE family epimerase/isomerase [Haliscomenobacter sp.]MBK9490811.1 AGE family epimerase/isomerase [Haliscomenobacter sp.]